MPPVSIADFEHIKSEWDHAYDTHYNLLKNILHCQNGICNY